MLTALLAVQNILGANHDLWEVNTDGEYQEEGNGQPTASGFDLSAVRTDRGQPRVPERITVNTTTPAAHEYEL